MSNDDPPPQTKSMGHETMFSSDQKSLFKTSTPGLPARFLRSTSMSSGSSFYAKMSYTAKQCWKVGENVIEIKHDRFNGKRAVIINGNVIECEGSNGSHKRHWFDRGASLEFAIDDRPANISIKPIGHDFQYILVVEGKLVPPMDGSGNHLLADHT
mmetsp:Transcript_42013/g.68153  ORF Transcript_42013/g.68153 Transcript_42013/m.68153 type:complete len:156 (+) Transcript_42013:170-637(+)